MKKLMLLLSLVASFVFVTGSTAGTAMAVPGGITKCRAYGTASGTGIITVTGTSDSSGKTKCAAYFKCSGIWPISDFYGYTDWATVYNNGSISCGQSRQPQLQWIVFA